MNLHTSSSELRCLNEKQISLARQGWKELDFTDICKCRRDLYQVARPLPRLIQTREHINNNPGPFSRREKCGTNEKYRREQHVVTEKAESASDGALRGVPPRDTQGLIMELDEKHVKTHEKPFKAQENLEI